jgi:hypothetical protein
MYAATKKIKTRGLQKAQQFAKQASQSYAQQQYQQTRPYSQQYTQPYAQQQQYQQTQPYTQQQQYQQTQPYTQQQQYQQTQPYTQPYARQQQHYQTQPYAQQYAQTDFAKKQKMLKIVGYVVKLLVIIGVPYSIYKFLKTFPLNIARMLYNLVTLRWGQLSEQLKDIFDINAYLLSFMWVIIGILFGLLLLAYCAVKKHIENGTRGIFALVLKEILAKFIKSLIPIIGQSLLIKDIVQCLMS